MVCLSYNLGTLEAGRNGPAANIEEQAEREWDIEIDAQNVGLNDSAKANRSFKVHEAIEERATRGHWGCAHSHIEQAP